MKQGQERRNKEKTEEGGTQAAQAEVRTKGGKRRDIWRGYIKTSRGEKQEMARGNKGKTANKENKEVGNKENVEVGERKRQKKQD